MENKNLSKEIFINLINNYNNNNIIEYLNNNNNLFDYQIINNKYLLEYMSNLESKNKKYIVLPYNDKYIVITIKE